MSVDAVMAQFFYQAWEIETQQYAKKVVSNSPAQLDFVIGLANSVFNLPNGQVMFLSNSNKGRTVKSILLVKKLLGLVQMMSGLVNASFSLPEGQAIKMIFFAPCTATSRHEIKVFWSEAWHLAGIRRRWFLVQTKKSMYMAKVNRYVLRRSVF